MKNARDEDRININDINTFNNVIIQDGNIVNHMYSSSCILLPFINVPCHSIITFILFNSYHSYSPLLGPTARYSGVGPIN